MKKLFVIPVLALAVACQNQPKTDDHAQETEMVVEGPVMAHFGAEINEDGAIDVAMISEKMAGVDSANLKISGTINEVCQAKGCWMTINNGEEAMRVTFRDYGFFVPKDASGLEVVAEGTVYMDTTSVADLQHYAQDAGKTDEEIAMITEPEVSLTFVADGVIIKDYKAAETTEEHMDHEHHDHDHSEEGHDH
ncbi:MAG: DUF4920 domain-containing protein [Salibacteraceae bacterium]|nr:DUF4920 domain-containing protein [Salibacteraceae bacterium]